MKVESVPLDKLVLDPSNARQAARFLERVSPGANGCWDFSETQRHTGYGKFHSNGVTWRAHRWVLWATGRINRHDPRCVLHTCDNRRCVNPAHLMLGDRYENAQHIKQRGRTRLIRDPKLGSRNPAAKLTEADVRAVRSALDAGAKGKDLAARYGVSRATISEIKSRKMWGHV
jgi:hypothetical protein